MVNLCPRIRPAAARVTSAVVVTFLTDACGTRPVLQVTVLPIS